MKRLLCIKFLWHLKSRSLQSRKGFFMKLSLRSKHDHQGVFSSTSMNDSPPGRIETTQSKTFKFIEVNRTIVFS